MPSLQEYLRHAELYGTDGVYESAEAEEHDSSTLALLRVELDALEAAARSGRYSAGKRRKRSREETTNAVRLLSVGGLTRREIAAKLGVSDKTVANYLAVAA